MSPQAEPTGRRNTDKVHADANEGVDDDDKEVDREAEEIVRRMKEEVDLDREYGRDHEDEDEREEVGKEETGNPSLEASETGPREVVGGNGDLPATPNSKSKSKASDPLALLASLSTPKDLKEPPASSSNPDSPTEELDPTYARLLSLKPARSGVEFPSVPKKAVDGSTVAGSGKGGAAGTKKAGWEIPGWTNDRDNDLDSWCCESWSI